MEDNHRTLNDILSLVEKFPNDNELGKAVREKYYQHLINKKIKKGGFVLGIDFDGTCVTHEFPFIGKDIGAVPILKKIVEAGNKLVLFTMRSDGDRGSFLKESLEWFEKNEIPLWGIQKNPTQDTWTSSPKAYCQIYIDDAALGCPLKKDPYISSKPFVNWERVEEMLNEMGVL